MAKTLKKSILGSGTLKDFQKAFSHMIFPDKCLICDEELSKTMNFVCVFCREEMHFTEFEKYAEPTTLDKIFWGRIQLNATYSLLYFEKGKSTQKILHALKYKSNPQVGIEFGKEIGRKIKTLPLFKDIDIIVPVPLHPKKEFDRGYNQSEQIAIGISEVISVDVDKNFLKKQSHTGSQTKKGRFERWDNVVNNFILKKSSKTLNHIAIVDDVITTGATLEALCLSIKKNYPDIRISIISLALTK